MSRQTDITLSFDRPPGDLAALVEFVLSVVGAEEVFLAYRTVGPSHEADRVAAWLAGETDDADEAEVAVGSRFSLDRAPGLYREGTCLRMILGDCPVLGPLDDELTAATPDGAMGEFYLNYARVVVGDHDVFAVDHGDTLTRLGRFFVSVIFEGQGTPDDPEALEQAFPALPTFTALRSALERQLGPGRLSLSFSV